MILSVTPLIYRSSIAYILQYLYDYSVIQMAGKFGNATGGAKCYGKFLEKGLILCPQGAYCLLKRKQSICRLTC